MKKVLNSPGLKMTRITLMLALILSPFLLCNAVFAISDPDSSPTITKVKANRNLIETGDVLLYGDYFIPYASVPSTSASDSFIFRLLDGTTEKGIITPYSLMDNGYNRGCFSFYFSAADNLTWDVAYTIRISQNPSQFDDPTYVDYIMSSASYTGSTDQKDNQTELAINIIAMATRLENYYDDYDFLDTGPAGTVLSSPIGETYFRNVIYGVQGMASSLFMVQALELDTTDIDWTTNQTDTYQSRFAGTWVGENATATGEEFNLSAQSVMGLALILPICFGSVILSSIKWKKAEPGFVVSAVALIPALLMGWVPTALFATVYQTMGIYLAYVWFYSRG